MCLAGWCALVCTASAVTTIHSHVSSSEEVIKQALVLIDILKSGYGHSSPTVPTLLYPITKLPNYARVPWPPPANLPLYYAYGPPFRRLYARDGHAYDSPLGRRTLKLNRQIQYEDPFGPHPGNDGKEKKKDAPSSPQSSSKSEVLNQDAAKASTTSTTTKTTTEETTETIKVTTEATKGTTEATKITNEATKATTEATKVITETTKETTKATNKRTSEIGTTIATKNYKNDISKGLSSTANIMKLNYIVNDTATTKVTKKDKNVKDVVEPELEQVAQELEREVTDTAEPIRNECFTTKQRKQKPFCGSGSKCNPAETNSYSWRFRGTTRVYLSRSSRPPIPLPDNHPFCHTNPESPLCRTFI